MRCLGRLLALVWASAGHLGRPRYLQVIFDPVMGIHLQ